MFVDSSSQRIWPIRWWQALSFSISVYLFSMLLVGYLSALLGHESTIKTGLLYAVGSLIMLIAFAGLIKIKKINLYDFIGEFALKQIKYLPIYYVGYAMLSRLAQSMIGFLPGVNVNQRQDFGILPNSGVELTVMFISLVVLPAVTEEILFRGLLYRSFKKPFGKVFAAIVVSFLFGLAHGQWNVAADTFVLSLVLVHLVEKYKSLWPAMALHLLKNLIAFLMVFVFKLA